jgi:hypothetical protein
MKAVYIIALLFGMVCMAQSIQPLYNGERNIDGAYYKDTNNDLDNFVGTWKYTNGATSLTIVLQKKEMQNYSDNSISYYEDILVGGYKYVENGVEKINTLPLPAQNLPDNYDYTIFGNIILPYDPQCIQCVQGKKILYAALDDPHRDITGMESKMIFARADSGSLQKLLLKFMVVSGGVDDVDNPRLSFSQTIMLPAPKPGQFY